MMPRANHINATNFPSASPTNADISSVTETPLPISFRNSIPVAGMVPLTMVDFPGRLALVIFTQGCPWRCSYCHNAGMRAIGVATDGSWHQVCDQLDRRRGFLEAVVFSGGEPTLHPGLESALGTVREKGFLTGLHTAGIFPERLRRLLPLLDWVGLDIKAPFDERYARLTGDRQSAGKVSASLDLLLTSEIPFQLRTTVTPGPQGEQLFAAVRRELRQRGAPDPVKQLARPAPALEPVL
jgi:pyruvate formate lyase activating enzyme